MRSVRLAGEIRSFAWVGFDQVFSALSNVIIAIAVTRASGAGGLGRYSVAFACYLLVLGFLRQLVSEPLMALRWHPEARNTVHDAPALGASVLYLVAASLVVLAVGVVTQRLELIVLAPLLPGVGMQDFGRYVAFRRRRDRLAAGLDALVFLDSAVRFSGGGGHRLGTGWHHRRNLWRVPATADTSPPVGQHPLVAA
jgi:hypothetical protein